MPGTKISTKEFVDILLRDYKLEFRVKFVENAKLAFSLVSSTEKFSLVTKSTRSDDSVDCLVRWIRKINE